MLGFLAAAAASVPLDRPSVLAWLKERGVTIGDKGLRRALELRLRRHAEGVPSDQDPAEVDWVRETLGFDATKLDLDLALVTFPASDRTAELRDVLRQSERMLRVYEGYDRDLTAVIVHDGAKERQRLQALFEEHEPNLRWIVLRRVDESSAPRTWLSLARDVAEKEGYRTS